MEFDLIIIEVNFYGGRLLIHMKFRRLCRYSIYIISLIREFISIIHCYDFREDSIVNGRRFGFIMHCVLKDISSLTQLKKRLIS